MTHIAQKILEEIKTLSPIERVELIDKIYETFDTEIDPEIEKAWAEEAQRRIAAYRKGNMETVPADEVFRRIRNGEI